MRSPNPTSGLQQVTAAASANFMHSTIGAGNNSPGVASGTSSEIGAGTS